MAVVAAGLGLALSGGIAVISLAFLAIALAALVSTSAVLLGVVLPIVQPFAALALAGAGALVWNQVTPRRGACGGFEGEVGGDPRASGAAGVHRREHSRKISRRRARRWRARPAPSAGLDAADALRSQLAAATAQEEQTRLRLHALERELRAADRRVPARRVTWSRSACAAGA